MANHEFPKFSESYVERWRSSGLWPNETLHGVFDRVVEKYYNLNAIIDQDDRIYTFADFKREADALAAGLLGIGVKKGDIVAVQLPNWPEFCFLQIALSRIGAVIECSHTVFREREVKNIYGFCETDFAVVPDTFKDFSYINMMRNVRADLPRLQKVVVVRGGARGDAECNFTDIIEEGRSHLDRLANIDVSPDDIYYLNFTSGTEGNPKGFLHTHNTFVPMAKAFGDNMKSKTPDVVQFGCSPMTHTLGHFVAYCCALSGVPTVLLDRFRPDQALRLIEKYRVTHFSGTPAHVMGVLHHPDYEKYDTSSIKTAQVGGARSSPELIKELDEKWGVSPNNTYGMGENMIHTATTPDDPEDKKRDTVGRPLPGVELKIVDQFDRTKEKEVGEVGEICFRGPTLFVGYHNQPELTARTRDEEGWFYTSDLGMVDEEGYLHYAGRAKEVINRGGSKIYPKEVEDVLYTHPKISDAAVVGMPDERLGERVCAYVVPKGEDVTREELEQYFNELKTMKYMIPEIVINIEELPMTPTGKIKKVTLMEDAVKRAKELQA